MTVLHGSSLIEQGINDDARSVMVDGHCVLIDPIHINTTGDGAIGFTLSLLA
jgi:hypothetical protein